MTNPKIQIKEIYHLTTQALKKEKKIFIPFLVFAAFELTALIFINLLPRMPLVKLFGPPIRTFWGEPFLHYPTFYILMPKLSSHARTFFSCVIGGVTSATAVLLTLAAFKKKTLDIRSSFKASFKKYFYLLTILLIITLLYFSIISFTGKMLAKYFMLGYQKLLFMRVNIWLGPIITIFNFTLALLIQALFIYAIPLVIIENKKLFISIWQGLVLFKKLFLKTLILIFIPMLLYIPLILLQYNIPFLINKTFPEFIFIVCLMSIFIGTIVIDTIITVSTTFLYLKYREAK